MHVPTTANHITGIVESNYHKILIFSPPKSLKSLRAARIDQLADSNEPATRKYSSRMRTARLNHGVEYSPLVMPTTPRHTNPSLTNLPMTDRSL